MELIENIKLIEDNSLIKWRFPCGKYLTPRGVNNSSIELFLDNIIESLTREVIQNSTDAHNKKMGKPVKVLFEIFEILTKEIPGINDITNDYLKKAIEFWGKVGNDDTVKFLNRFSEIAKKDKIKVLKISDYNTTGLNDENYKSLINGESYSKKSDEGSAGSKGIGKAAPFAASELRMVFYNTFSLENVYKSAGVLNFVSFNNENDETVLTQDKGIFCDEDMNSIKGQITFGKEERTDYGTDLFIIGIKDFKDLERKIVISVINNFLISILNNKLEVQIGKYLINQDNLKNIILEIEEEFKLESNEKNEFKKTKNFYEAVKNENSIKLDFDERFLKYDFIENLKDGELIICSQENANRTILQTRRTGMKIYERNKISSNINFTGIFQAKGNKLNKFLKDLENANHDKWSVDRKSGIEKQIAQKFLRDLFIWYKESVKNHFGLLIEEEIEAIGVKDLLPVNINKLGGDRNIDKGIKKNILETKLSNNKIVKDIDNNSEETITYIDSEFYKSRGGNEDGVSDLNDINFGNGSGTGIEYVKRRGRKTNGTSTDKYTGEGVGNGFGSKNGDEKKGQAGKEKGIGLKEKQKENVKSKFKKDIANNVKFKIVEIDYLNGIYRLIGKSNINVEKLELKLNSIGQNSEKYPLDIIKVDSNTNLVEQRNNNIFISKITKNNIFIVNLQVESKIRIKMRGDINEIKR